MEARVGTARELQLVGETRAACTPAQVRGVLSRIAEAIEETSSEMQKYIKNHVAFADVGEGMLKEWRKGIAESLSPRVS